MCPFSYHLTKRLKKGIIIEHKWSSTQEAEEVPLLRV